MNGRSAGKAEHTALGTYAPAWDTPVDQEGGAGGSKADLMQQAGRGRPVSVLSHFTQALIRHDLYSDAVMSTSRQASHLRDRPRRPPDAIEGPVRG